MARPYRTALWAFAVVAALAPLPAPFVERVYSRGIYPAFQPYVTRASNLVPVALLDIAFTLLVAILVLRVVRTARGKGWRRAALCLLTSVVTTAAVVYLLFLASWGYNYRRVPLEAKLDFDRSRVTHEAAERLATHAIGRLNAGHAAAHAAAFGPDILEKPFVEAQRLLGGNGAAATGRPKRSLFGLYFRHAAIDGMTVPIFLEIILNPDLLPIERPSVLAHEWAHLAGYADESEANFMAWTTGVRSDNAVAQYSAWLDVYRLAVRALPRSRRERLPPLGPGPRADFAAIAARHERSSPAVRNAARGVYDSYLKANRIEEGIANYEAVLQLILGTTHDAEWTPRLRQPAFR